MTRHGLTEHPLYNTWASMIDRCYDNTNPSFAYYGARGIAVCDEWRSPEGAARFIADMDDRPHGHTLDRIDNDGPYSKANCQWLTPKGQVMKQRHTHIITHNGRTGSIADWSRWTKLGSSTIRLRLRGGQGIAEALKPVNRRWPDHSAAHHLPSTRSSL